MVRSKFTVALATGLASAMMLSGTASAMTTKDLMRKSSQAIMDFDLSGSAAGETGSMTMKADVPSGSITPGTEAPEATNETTDTAETQATASAEEPPAKAEETQAPEGTEQTAAADAETAETADNETAKQDTSDPDGPYILGLPQIEGVTYTSVDAEHISDKYSTDKMAVLLYDAGEEVNVTVDTEYTYSVYDVVGDNDILRSADVEDGKVTFAMPKSDLVFRFYVPGNEDTPIETDALPDVKEAEQTEEAPSGQAVETVETTTEAAAQTPDTEAAEEKSTETELQKKAAEEIPAETEAVSEAAETEADAKADAETAQESVTTENDPELQGLIESGAEVVVDENGGGYSYVEHESLYPEDGTTETFDKTFWVKDRSLTFNSLDEYGDEVVLALKDGTLPDFDTVKAGDTFTLTYDAYPSDDVTRIWTVVVNYTAVDALKDATETSDEAAEYLPSWIPVNDLLTAPVKKDDVIDGLSYTAYTGDPDFNIYGINNGYDVKKFRSTISDNGGFDINTPGTYYVTYELTYFLAPDYNWYVKTKIDVVDSDADVRIDLQSDTMKVRYNGTDMMSFGVPYKTTDREFSLTAEEYNTNFNAEIDPKAVVSDGSSEYPDMVTRTKKDDGTYEIAVSLPYDNKPYTITVTDEANDLDYTEEKRYMGNWRAVDTSIVDYSGLTAEQMSNLELYYEQHSGEGIQVTEDEAKTLTGEEYSQKDLELKYISSIPSGATKINSKSFLNAGTPTKGLYAHGSKPERWGGAVIKIKQSSIDDIVSYSRSHGITNEEILTKYAGDLPKVSMSLWCHDSDNILNGQHSYMAWEHLDAFPYNLKITTYKKKISKKWHYYFTISASANTKHGVDKRATGKATKGKKCQAWRGSKSFEITHSPTNVNLSINKEPANFTETSSFPDMSGAIFEIVACNAYHTPVTLPNGKSTWQRTTDKNGDTEDLDETDGLMTGYTYRVTEIQAPPGFQCDKAPQYTKVMANGDHEEFTFKDYGTSIRLQKVSADTNVTDGNPGYSLAGAKFIVSNASGSYTLVTNENGTSNVVDGVAPGMYTVHEEVAPPGYQKVPDFQYEIKAGVNGIQTIPASDPPIMFPVDLSVKKEVTIQNPLGDSKKIYNIDQVVFEVDYYKTSDGSGDPAYRWKIHPTNEGTDDEPNYVAKLDKAHLVEGSEALAYQEGFLPYGYIKVWELDSPAGLTKSSDVFASPVNQETSGSFANINIKDFDLNVQIVKKDAEKDAEKDAALEGAELQILDSANNAVDSWTSDGAPHRTTKVKEEGTYTVVETKAPAGYVKASPVQFTVKNTPDLQTYEMKDKQVFAKKVSSDDTALSGCEMSVLDSEGKEVDKWTTDGSDHAISGLTAGGTYSLVETKAADGYTIAKPVSFTVADDFKNQTVTMKDKKLVVTKTTITGTDELPGAHLTVTDKDDNVMDEWTSGDKPHEVQNLHVGETYTLTEVVAPDGFVKAESIQFTVEDDMKDQTVHMQDEQVLMTKVDVTGEKEVPGAKIVVKDENGKTVDSWVSTDKPHAIDGLVEGGNYTLTEEAAPEGYVRNTESILFKATREKKDVTITMKNKRVLITKTDLTGSKEIEGAHLAVLNKDGKTVDEWVSTTEAHAVSGLEIGEKYTLVETKPADGYVTAESIEFEADSDMSKDQEITMKDDVTKIYISKKELATGSELPGAHLVIKDDEGKTVEEWDSTTEPHYIEMLPIGTYSLVETKPADGYATAETVTFEVKDTGEIQHAEMVDDCTKLYISKKDITTGEELPGAHLVIKDKDGNLVEEWDSTTEPHYIEKLPIGSYTLTETKPADGYTTAETIAFDIQDTAEIQHVEMKDDVTKVYISKQDITTKKELPGAVLIIKDADGNEVEKWTSTNEPHYIEKLPIGDYTLTEITAPNGYQTAETVKFTISDTSEEQHVVMYDSPNPTTPGPNSPQTGDTMNLPMIICGACAAALLLILGIAIAGKKKKKAKAEEDKDEEKKDDGNEGEKPEETESDPQKSEDDSDKTE